MTEVQLGWVASKQGKPDEALDARRHRARRLLAAPKDPPVLDALLADAYLRQNRYADAREPARRVHRKCTEEHRSVGGLRARSSSRVGDHSAALAAATKGLELSPRDPDLLRAQATALAALGDPQAPAAEAAFARFRAADNWATLRIACAKQDARCARERNAVPTIAMH